MGAGWMSDRRVSRPVTDPMARMFAELADILAGALAARVEDLTEAEKLAIAIGAGCEIEVAPDPEGAPGQVVLRTKHAVGFVEIDGRIDVRERTS